MSRFENSRIKEYQEEVRVGRGKGYVNIVNGRLLFVYPLVEEGENTYNIETSISYSNETNGNRWKINFHQYLAKEGEEYIYIDSKWYKHIFKKYKEEGNKKYYYDEDKTGLKLIEENNNYIITDEMKNKYYYDNLKRLIRYESGINSEIRKEIEYENGKITKVYDNRKTERKIIYSYNSEDLLERVYKSDNSMGYILKYKDKKLINIIKYITKENKEYKKEELELVYDENNEISYIINSSDLIGIKISYRDDKKVEKVIEGAVTKGIKSESSNLLYLNDDVRLGEDYYVGEKSLIFKGYSYEIKNNNIIRSREYTYSSNCTRVKNEDELIYEYYFDSSNEVISLLECKKRLLVEDDQTLKYYTLTKNEGQKISILENRDDVILSNEASLNDKALYVLNRNNNYTYRYDVSKIKGAKYYKLTLWTNYKNNDNLTLKINYENVKVVNDTEVVSNGERKLKLRKTENRVWQKLSTVIKLDLETQELRELKISFEGAAGNEVLISDLFIEVASSNELIIYNDNNKVIMDEEANIYYEVNGVKEIKQINNEFYMTLNDIIQTYRNILYSKINNKDKYDLVCKDNGEVITVSKGGITKEGIEIDFSIDSNNNSNYYIRSIKTQEASPVVVSETTYKTTYENNEYYMIVKTISKETKVLDSRLDEETAYIVEEKMSIKGIPQSKRIKNIKEEYTIKYIYDEYGNIVEEDIYNGQETEANKKVKTLYEYDNNIPRLKEKIKKIIERGVETKYESTSNKEVVINNGIKKEYTYDPYQEVIKQIEFYKNSNNELISRHDMKYLWNGNIEEIKDENNKYRYGYDVLTRLIKVEGTNTNINIKREKNKVIKETRGGSETKITDTYEYDKYGKILKYKNNEEEVRYEYDSSEANESLKRIVKIVDGFSNGEETKYTYSEKEELKEIGDKLKVRKGSNYIEYEVKGENSERYEKVYDLRNGVIKKSICKEKVNGEYQENKAGSYEYTYDVKGRAVRRLNQNNGYSYIKNIGYDENDILTKYEYNMIDQYYLYAKTIYTNTYDSRYNITNVKRKREYYGRTGIVKQEERNNSYEYDIYNRLIKEETELGEYIYEYNNNNRISKVYKNGEKIKEYKYNNNLLTKINNDDIIKDSRGNIIKVGNKEYGYNNRGLIESYTKGEERYKYYYNYLGQRNKKERYKKEENEWKLKESKEYYLDEGIIIEESSGEEKLKYYYDKDGVSGIRYKGKNYELIRDILNNVREVVLNGKVIGEYLYDGWGNVEVRLTQGITKEEQYVIENNPYRYRGYYYDKETGLFMMGQRYYSPELCRFIQPADVSTLNPRSINGLNLYSFSNNNPIGIAYSSFGATFGTSGGMIGSTRGTIGNIVGSGSVGGGSKISGFGSLGGSSFSSINWPKANSVAMTHYTTSLIKNPFISWMLGNISYTKTVQLNSAETFYSFSNIGNDGYSAGVGFNFGNWYGGSVYVSSDIGFGSSWQLTPWLTGSSGWSLENGISISGGVIIGDTTHEITVSIGNGALLGYAACAGIAAIPVPGARAVAATAACIIFIIDLFN